MTEQTITATASDTGYLIKNDSSWSNVWGAATAGGFESQSVHEAEYYFVSGDFYLTRGRIRFDTSAINQTVTTAKIKIAFSRTITLKGTHYLYFVGAIGCGDELNTADWAALRNNTTNISNSKFQVGNTFDTYFEIPLNPYGLSLINTNGYTVFGLRFENDINNVAPVDGTSECWTSWYGSAITPITGYEIKLVVSDSIISETRDFVTRVVTRVGTRHYTNELSMGGLPTRWLYKEDYGMVGEAEAEIVGEAVIMYEIIDNEMRFFWLLPDGTKEYIENL